MLASDNGGALNGHVYGINEPLRGGKYDHLEGGVRVPAFIYSARLPARVRGAIFDGLMHVTDWMPTLMSIATNDTWNATISGHPVDGKDMWSTINNLKRDGSNVRSPRDEIIITVDDVHNISALILNDNKSGTLLKLLSTGFDDDVSRASGLMFSFQPQSCMQVTTTKMPASISSDISVVLAMLVAVVVLGILVILCVALVFPSRSGLRVWSACAQRKVGCDRALRGTLQRGWWWFHQIQQHQRRQQQRQQQQVQQPQPDQLQQQCGAQQQELAADQPAASLERRQALDRIMV